jgi:FkbM family methyltransferase
MTETRPSGPPAAARRGGGLLTRLARLAARVLRAGTSLLATRRPGVPGAARLMLALLFMPLFAVCYAMLRLHARLRGPLVVQAVTTWGGRFEAQLPELIQMYIHLFGVWEPDVTAFIRGRLAPGETFVDVGAFIGYHAVLAAKTVGGAGRVVAIEASPTFFRWLQRTLALNDAGNGSDVAAIRTVNVAVSDVAGTARIHHGPLHNLGLSTTLESRGLPPGAEVPTAPLADLLEPGEIETVRMIKIDVEGAEDRILRGLPDLVARCPATVEIIVELSPAWWTDRQQTADQVLAPLFEAGFHAYRIDNNLWPWRYLWARDVRRPVRVRRAMVKRVKRIDLVLSRQDRQEL